MTKKEMRKETDALIASVQELLERLIVLRSEMHNRPPKMRGKRTSAPITPEIVEKVKQLHNIFPDENQNILGNMLGIPGARVSEIIAGKRT